MIENCFLFVVGMIMGYSIMGDIIKCVKSRRVRKNLSVLVKGLKEYPPSERLRTANESTL